MDNFIEVYKQALSDEFCTKAIQYFDEKERTGHTKNRQETQSSMNKTDKDDQNIFNFNHANSDLQIELNETLWVNCYEKYADKYDILKSCGNHNSYTQKLQKTKPGQGFHVWHAESMNKSDCNRLLVWTAYLNDDFEAGETEFLYQHYRYKPSKGDVVIFPAAFTHTHRGNPPIGGDKYIITGWIEY